MFIIKFLYDFSFLNFTIIRIIVLTIPFLLLFNSCKDNPVINGGPPCPSIVSSPAYNNPIWHPGGEFIGFNHTPLRKITFPYEGCPHLGHNEFDYDSTGFWLINSDGTNMRRIFPYTLQNPAWSPDGE